MLSRRFLLSVPFLAGVILFTGCGEKTSRITLAKEAADISAPSAGNSGTLSTSSVSLDGLHLSWTKATDNSTAVADLKYQVYYSMSDNISTVADMIANGTASGSQSTDINSATVSGLYASSTYYFNVLVEDESGNQTAYSRTSQTTLAPTLTSLTTAISVPTAVGTDLNTIWGYGGIVEYKAVGVTNCTGVTSGDGSVSISANFGTSGQTTTGWAPGNIGDLVGNHVGDFFISSCVRLCQTWGAIGCTNWVYNSGN